MTEVIAVILLLLSSFGLGALVFQKSFLCGVPVLERSIATIVTGLGIWCLLLFLLGHLHLFHTVFLSTLTIGISVTTLFIFHRQLTQYIQKYQFHSPSVFEITSIVIVSIIGIVTFIACYSPVMGDIQNDEIATHLSVPKAWLMHHGIEILGYPVHHLAGHGSLLFLMLMSFGSDRAPKLFSWICLFLIILMIYSFTYSKSNRRAAIIASLSIAINPLLFRSTFTAFVDLSSALFNLMSLWALLKFHENRKFSVLALSAFFLGIACGVKPTNFFYAPVLFSVAVYCVLSWRDSFKQTLKTAVLFVAISTIIASPWPTRNIILTKSPTFPPPIALYLLTDNKPFYFSGLPYTIEGAKQQYDYYFNRIKKHGTGVVNFFLLPWNLTMHPEDFSAGDSIGTLMLSVLPLLLLFIKRWGKWQMPLLIFMTTGTMSIYFLIFPEARYFIPVFIAGAPLIGWTIDQLLCIQYLKIGIYTTWYLNLIFSTGTALRITINECRAVFDSSYREAFFQKNTPFAEAFRFLKTLNHDSVYVFFDNQIFYYFDSPYAISANDVVKHPELYPNAYIFDIDYSQAVQKNRQNMKYGYILKETPEYCKTVFVGPDARIYQVIPEPVKR